MRALLLACSLLVSAVAACKATPELAMDHLRRGDAALAEGRYAAALAAYGHARELAPSDSEVQRAMMRARVYLIAESAARISPDAMEDARYEATFLIDTDKAHTDVYLTALANVLARQGDVDGAKLKLADALKADPKSWLAHSALASLHMARKEDAPKAKAELEAALAIKPDAVSALIALGQLKLAEGDLPGAIEKLETALRSGDDFDARMALGRARMQQQKPADAIEQFDRAARLNPKSADALVRLGQAMLSAGKPEDAEQALRAASQMRPDIETQMGLAFALLQQKKLEPALSLFTQILAQSPDAPAALFGAGSASDDLGQRDRALEHFRRLLAISPGGPDQQAIADMQRAASSRVAALSAAEAATSSSASASAPPSPKTRGRVKADLLDPFQAR